MSVQFNQFALSPTTLRSVAELGYDIATPVQERVIPLMLEGRDVIAQAQTGTGKTAAFALPILERIDASLPYTQAIVMAPTRELAVQVAEAVQKIGKYTGVSSLAVYGGQPIGRQLTALRRGVQVVVGTPGRIMDHLRRESLDLSKIKIVVLDEADEMLDMGFIEDIESILEHMPADKQMGLFSATIPPRIAALAQKYLHQPERVTINKESNQVAAIRQVYYEVMGRDKTEALMRIMDFDGATSTIVFCARKMDVDTLGETLQGRGYSAETLHGDLNQVQRDRVMARFRSSQVDILVATDVAARGLDVPDVSHVVNFDIPWDPESYVHRIGRTGRAGKSGDAITLVSPREIRQLRLIERVIGKRLERLNLPTPADVAAKKRAATMQTIRETITAGGLESYRKLVDTFADEFDVSDVAAAVMKVLGKGALAPIAEKKTEKQVVNNGGEQGMTRLFIRAGKRAGIRPSDIVGAIANEANLPGHRVGAISLFDNFSFVDVPSGDAGQVVAALGSTTLRGQPVSIDIAKPQ